ncbi:MAG: ABC transporter ATP-binding protein, partial [Desulfobacteraceae bacterium]
HLNLAVPQGGCFGLLGPNGAGKTTLIEIIEDIISPTSGHILYQGMARNDEFREQIGIMFQQTALLSFMTVQETLATFQSLYSISYDIDQLIKLCHLEEIRHQLNDKISGGQRQRLLFALALINQPNLIFLDEPSTGLDPQARRNLWGIVENVKAQGKTIILTTHYMEEAQHLCDKVAIMDQGKIIAQGSPHELIHGHGGGTAIALPSQALKTNIDQIPFEIKEINGIIEILCDHMNPVVAFLLETGADMTQMKVRTPNLETVFLNLTGRRLRE